MEILLAVVVSFVAGIFIGTQSEADRWRANALVPFRIESKGRLYKVTRDEETIGGPDN